MKRTEKDTEKDLKDLSILIQTLSCVTSSQIKQSILRKFPSVKRLLKYTYSKDKIFNITSNSIRHQSYMGLREYKDIYKLLEDLSNRTLSGDEAIESCLSLIHTYPQYEEIIYRIIDKDLKCGISTKTINSVFPKTIPEFSVPLGNKYDPKKHKDVFDGTWLISRKLDGVRCLIFITKNEITAMSRNGKKFFTVDKILEDIRKNWKGMTDIVLDGELCSIDKAGNEDFQSIISVIRRKDFTIPDPRFKIFDVYPVMDFKEGKSYVTYSKSIDLLRQAISKLKHSSLIDMEVLTHKRQLVEYPDHWEGLMIRKDAPTIFKRSNHLLKVKSFKEKEYEVLDIQTGPIKMDNQYIDTVSSLLISHEGNCVKVGSGISHQERIKWYDDPSKILGKIITVKYFEESRDKNGRLSLRFPIFKGVRDYD